MYYVYIYIYIYIYIYVCIYIIYINIFETLYPKGLNEELKNLKCKFKLQPHCTFSAQNQLV